MCVFLSCEIVTRSQDVNTCPLTAACIPVWQPNGKGTTDTSRHLRDMMSDIKETLTKQINKINKPNTDRYIIPKNITK